MVRDSSLDFSVPGSYGMPLNPVLDGYASTRVSLSKDPKEPIPYGMRMLSPPRTLDMMLRVVGMRGSPVRPERFSRGMLRTSRKQYRGDMYFAEVSSGDPFDFARAYRDMAERRRLNMTVGEEERRLLGRMYRDLVFEVQHSMDVPADKAEQIVQKAQGFDILKAQGMRPRRKSE